MTHTLKQGEKGIDLPLKTPSIWLTNQSNVCHNRQKGKSRNLNKIDYIHKRTH